MNILAASPFVGFNADTAVFLAACSVILVITLFWIWLAVLLQRYLRRKNDPELNRKVAQQLTKPIKFYGKVFMNGYNEGKRRY